jgi:cytoskeletal protein RodZ
MSSERVPGDFGAKLRQARERRGLSLRQIANATKISVAALEALERNEWARLPGGIFSRAFVRAYALEVGLDPEETTQEFVAQFPRDSLTAGRSASIERDENQVIESDRRMAVTALWLVVLSIPIAGIVLYLSTASIGPDRPDPLGPAAAEPLATGTTAADAEVPAGAGEPVAPAAGDAPADPPGLVGQAGSRAELTIGIEATGPCWIEATVDGARVLAHELRAGDRHLLAAGREIELKVGDPAALTMTLNGVAARPLGSPGQVVTRRFTPANFQQYLITQ